MSRDEFIDILAIANSWEEYQHIVRKHLFHGIPFVFKDRTNDYFDFRACIANNFNIDFHEVFIVGSAKLGFSYHKKSEFSLESDIDVVLVNERLFEKLYKKICGHQYEIESGLVRLTEKESNQYNIFIQYLIKGWMRPDKLPMTIQKETIKDDWFNFFNSISYGNSCVGNYKVAGGLFKSYYYLEKYYTESLLKIKK